MLITLVLYSTALAELFEPYTPACLAIAATKNWPCNNQTAEDYQNCLCDIPDYNEMTFLCLKLATNNTDSYKICPNPKWYTMAKTIGLDAWREIQIKDMIHLVSAQQSISATTVNRKRAEVLSNGIFIYWLGVMALFGIANMWLWLHPQSYTTFFNFKPVKWIRKTINFSGGLEFSGVSILEYLILVGFVVMNASFLFYNIPLVVDHVSLHSFHTQCLKHIADRASYCAAKMMPLVVFFGGRNGFLMTLCGWDSKRSIVFHRWIGRLMLLNLIVHGCCYAAIKITAGTLVNAMKTQVFQFGTATLVLLGLMVIQSLKILRKRFHEIFIALHVTFWLAVFACGYCHVRKMHWGRQVFWASMGLWAIDYFFRLFKITINGGFKKAIVTVHDNKVVEVAIKYEGCEDHCGTFAYLHFTNLQWWQSHPFSYYCDGEYMRFMITPRNGLTNRINRLAQYRAPHVLIDGPYGTRPNLEMFDTVIFIAGGIGITATIGHIRMLLRTQPEKHVHLHWAVKGAAYLEFVEYVLRNLPGNLMVSIYMCTTKVLSSIESINNSVSSFGVKSYQSELQYCLVKSRLCVKEIVSSHIFEGSKEGPVAVVVCGPSSMASEAAEAITGAMMECPQFIELYNQNYEN